MSVRDKLKDLPKNPGCYLYKNKDGEVIYVGKAKNLSNRVKSYFTGSHNAKTTKLIENIYDLEFIMTSTEAEAFILENNLIKKYHPKYNIMLMDDKMYPYICLTNELHPRVFYTRDLRFNGKYYGPFPNQKSCKKTIEMINKIYPLRKCNRIPKKECLYYHLNMCLGPCINKIDSSMYNEYIDEINGLLKGNISNTINSIEKLMNEASSNCDFEKAIEYRNLINDIKDITIKQNVEGNIKDCDVINYNILDDFINIMIFYYRGGKLINKDSYIYDLIDNKEEMFASFINGFYLNYNNPIPKEILLCDINLDLIDERLRNKIIIPKQGSKKELVDLVLVNINKELENSINKKKRSYDLTLGATLELNKLLGLKSSHRIEAFDNSNISGVSSVSCMVTYIDGVKSLKDYRKFKVKTIVGIDDVNTFKEIITRRYSRVKEENLPIADVIMMDGGKGQVNACIESLKKLDLSIDVIGLVKDNEHKTNHILYNDKLYLLDKHSNLYKFLFGIQEEVHRYAISYFHNTHTKNLLRSKFSDIKGIGKKKTDEILRLVGDSEFNEKIKSLHLTQEQLESILKIYNPD